MSNLENLDLVITQTKKEVEGTPQGKRLKILEDINSRAKDLHSRTFAKFVLLGCLVGIPATYFTGSLLPSSPYFGPDAVTTSIFTIGVPTIIGAYIGARRGTNQAEKFITQETTRQNITL